MSVEKNVTEGGERMKHNTNILVGDQLQSTEDVIKFYDNWSQIYETDFQPSTWGAPRLAAEAVSDIFPEAMRSVVKVMDIAAGTGIVGELLHKEGFRHFDALDASKDMLEKLRMKDIYTQILHDTIGDHKIDVEDGVYDAVVMAGGFLKGHCPITAVDDMIRICKPGGVVVICMREEFLRSEEYMGLEPYMKGFEEKGLWTLVSRKISPNYYFDKEGITFTYRRT